MRCVKPAHCASLWKGISSNFLKNWLWWKMKLFRKRNDGLKGTQQPETWLWKKDRIGLVVVRGFPSRSNLGSNPQSATYLASLGFHSLYKIQRIIAPQKVILRIVWHNAGKVLNTVPGTCHVVSECHLWSTIKMTLKAGRYLRDHLPSLFTISSSWAESLRLLSTVTQQADDSSFC